MQAQILITLTDEGQLQLTANGQAQQKLIAAGMLEMAKDLVLHPPEQPSPIVTAREIPVPINGSR